MDKINIFDKHFITYSDSSALGKFPREFEYVKAQNNFDGITIYTDSSFEEAKRTSSKYKIAWQLESPYHSQRKFNAMIGSYPQLFDMIFTYDENLITKYPKRFKRCNAGGTTVINPNLYSDQKIKTAAIVHSGGNSVPNHKMRTAIARSGKVDVFGKITGKPFDNIVDVLTPYKYSVVVENINSTNYFSEKLTDCIACGCIPIYNGCTNVEDYFNIDGMIRFKTLEELRDILPTLNDTLYDSMFEAHEDNVNTVFNDYYTSEDWLYLTYMKDLIHG